MKKNLLYVASLTLVMVLVNFSSCKKTSSNYNPSCSGATKTYSADAAPVFQSACAGCHSGKYDNYSGVSADKSDIRSKVLDGSMPQNSTLTDAQKNAIICWIDAGALNN